MLDEVPEELHFHGRQRVNGLAVPDLKPGKIDGHVPELVDVARLHPFERQPHPGRAIEQVPHAGQKLREGERLRQVLVGPAVKRLRAVLAERPGAQDQNRNPAVDGAGSPSTKLLAAAAVVLFAAVAAIAGASNTQRQASTMASSRRVLSRHEGQ